MMMAPCHDDGSPWAPAPSRPMVMEEGSWRGAARGGPGDDAMEVMMVGAVHGPHGGSGGRPPFEASAPARDGEAVAGDTDPRRECVCDQDRGGHQDAGGWCGVKYVTLIAGARRGRVTGDLRLLHEGPGVASRGPVPGRHDRGPVACRPVGGVSPGAAIPPGRRPLLSRRGVVRSAGASGRAPRAVLRGRGVVLGRSTLFPVTGPGSSPCPMT